MLNRTETRQPGLTVTAFAEVPYSPALLLESSFDASVTDSDEFHLGCKWGFDAYFDTMYGWGSRKRSWCLLRSAIPGRRLWSSCS